MAITFQEIYDKFTEPRVKALAQDRSGTQTPDAVVEEQISSARIELKSIALATDNIYDEANEYIIEALIRYTMSLLYRLNQKDEQGENEAEEAYRILTRIWGPGVLQAIDFQNVDMESVKDVYGSIQLIDWETYDDQENQ